MLVHRAVRLKDFSRIHLKPGETKAVDVFRFPQTRLALWNANGKWALEPGGYTFWIGGSSRSKSRGKTFVAAVNNNCGAMHSLLTLRSPASDTQR